MAYFSYKIIFFTIYVTVTLKRMTNVSVTKRPCHHGVKPPCPPCSSTNLTNIATSPCPPCSLTNIANMVTSHCPPYSLTNSTVTALLCYGQFTALLQHYDDHAAAQL